MCDVMVALTVASAAMQYQQSRAQAAAIKQEAANNKNIMEFNARQQDIAADDAVQRGAQNSANIRENYKRTNATARARLGSAGLIADAGSGFDIQGQNAQTGEYNAMSAMIDAEREAAGFKNQATSDRFAGDVGVSNASYTSKITRQQGLLDAGTTLVTGVGKRGIQKGWWK